MAQGIRAQLLYPLWVLLAGMALMGLLLVESNLSAQKLEISKRLERLEGAVSKVAIPKTLLVLQLMRDMSGADLLMLDGNGRLLLDDAGRPLVTLSTGEMGPGDGQALLQKLLVSGEPRLQWQDKSYRGRIIPWGPGNQYARDSISTGQAGGDSPLPLSTNGNLVPDGTRVVALIAEQTFLAALWQASRPLFLPLLVGGMLAFALAVAQANRIMARIKGIETQTKRISQGDFLPMLLPPGNDELRTLAQSVNRMAGQLSEFAKQLREDERLKLLGQVGAGLAHQLRNATTGAKLALQLHARACDRDPEDIQVALKQLEIMERHVGGFLNLGKESPLRRESLDAMHWVQKIIRLTEPMARHFRTTVEWVVKKDGPESLNMSNRGLAHFGDSAQLEHMLQNLITNALEATGPGGVVKVELNPRGSGGDSPNLEITVLDNGPGVSPHIAEKLFTPFATGKAEGVGLGLAVARQVARAHGGDITCFREGGWTRFRVTLARDPSSQSESPGELDHV